MEQSNEVEAYAIRSVDVIIIVLVVMLLYNLSRRYIFSRCGKVVDFAGKVVWITGASQGIGRSLAIAFHCAGARVILSARNKELLQEVAEECKKRYKSPNPPLVVEMDLCSDDSITRAAAAVKQQLSASTSTSTSTSTVTSSGAVDVLVHNAGMSVRASALDTQMDVERRVMQVNYFGAIHLTKLVLPDMLLKAKKSCGNKTKSGGGCGGGASVVVVSSLQGKFGLPFRATYAASKHALHGWFDALRHEVAQLGVHVTMVCPGYVRTNLSLNAVTSDGKTYGKSDETTEKGMNPDVAAQQILVAVAAGDHEIYVCSTLHYYVSTFVNHCLPRVLYRILQRRSKKDLQEYGEKTVRGGKRD